MKIGFFETYNAEADKVEFSITRVQMVLMTLFVMFFSYQYFVTEGNPVTVNSIMLILVFLFGAYFPKALKDLASLKDKIK